MGKRSERRKYARVPVELITRTIKLDSKQGVLPDPKQKTVTTDLSQSGVFVETSAPFEVGSFVAVELQLPGEKKKISVAGFVRWRRTGSPAGIGVEIVRVKTTGKARLDRYLQRCAEQVPEDG